uniref:Uncharacterized protein n=1 Tax=Anguilla anguilla TaxID=7936 RepID=A0A0E9WRA6_ANGAN
MLMGFVEKDQCCDVHTDFTSRFSLWEMWVPIQLTSQMLDYGTFVDNAWNP